MPVFVLYVKAELENVARLRPTSTSYCISVREVGGDDVREGVHVDSTEEEEMSGSKGSANFVMKWKESKREASISVTTIKGLVRDVTEADHEKWVPIVALECRGCEPFAYRPEVREFHDPMESAAQLVAFATDMLTAARQVRMPHNQEPVNIRIGIHSGPCVSGIIGNKLPKFSVFGDSMNTASRMESTCVPGRLQISDATYHLLLRSGASSTSDWEPTGGVEVKGKGVMETYLWRPREEPAGEGQGDVTQALSTALHVMLERLSLAPAGF